MGEAKRRREAKARGEPDPGPSSPTQINGARYFAKLADGTTVPIPGRVIRQARAERLQQGLDEGILTTPSSERRRENLEIQRGILSASFPTLKGG